MECKYCGENDESRLMMRSQLVNGTVETIDVCLECWWFKEIHTDGEDGRLLSKKELPERRVSDKPEFSYPPVGENAG